jgi:opacity protein-like surface antigen
MLRILIVATLLLLVSATSVQAGSSVERDESATVQFQIGARAGALAFLQPALRARMAAVATHRTINGLAQARQAADGRNAAPGTFSLGGKPGLALPVSDSVSLGLRYQYLRREDIRLEAAKAGSLDEGYSSHKLVLRARWQF